MRNTFVAKEQQHSLGLQSAFGLSTHLSLDSESGLTYVARNGLTVACCRCADGQVLRSVSLPEAAAQGGFDLAPSAVITHFAHVPELEAITIGLSSGELLLLNTATAAIADSASGGGSSVGIQLPTLEEVGAVEGGVAAGQWSPDGELLALLTGDGQLLLMNKEWELLAERPVRGHYERSSADFQLQHDQVAISWRGDGRYVATCTPQQAQHSVASTAGAAALGPESPAGYCEVCIWEREGLEPHATGEHAPALYPLLSWQPNGRHLYAAQKLSAAQQAAQQAADQGQHAAEDEEAQQARIGAWKREMRRQEAEAAAAAAAGGEASNRVVLYERNGLQHGGFDVPGPGVVAAMGWSRDSDLLAIVLKDGGRGGSGLPSCRLQLWHRSNWHWYLKSERRFEMCEGLAIQWDDLAARRLHILTSDGDYLQVDMDWCPLVSGRGTAAVLDGRRVLLTPLRHAIVPPPMCSAALQCSGALACAALCDFGDREVLAAVLGDGSLELATSCEEDLWEETLDEHQEAQEAASAGAEPAGRAGAQQAQQAASCGSEPCLLAQQLSFLETTVSLVGARQAAWAAEDRLLVVVGEGQVVELRINSEAGTATQVAALRLPVPLVCCISQPQRGCILQLEGGQLLQYEPGGQLREQPVAGSFPTSCPCMVASPAVATGRALPLAFGLSSKGQLYWGSQLLANDVTSVVVRAEGAGGAFLLYTTRTHLLYSLPLSSLEQQQQQPGSSRPGLVHLGSTAGAAGQPQQQSFSQAMRAAMRPEAAPGGAARDVRVRAVEQNALLVAAPPGGEVVVLQMPRGNLEVIRPRALVLPAVAAAIDGGDWARAWELASVNRLDLNVLVDYQWPAFLSRARDFIQQVGSDQDIADLLSALSPNSAVAEGGTYAGGLAELPPTAAAAAAASLAGPALATLPVRTNPGQTEIANGGLVVMMNGSAKEATAQEPRQQEQQQHGKVAAVCRAVRGAIEVTDMPARFLRSLLTSYAKCDELEGALAIVKQRKEAELQGGAVPGAPSAEEGLKHLLLFINEDVVYRAALGAYDLPLAYMVVAHSQKDPGEYMMELQRFASLPEGPLRSHAIDMHLRRFESALRHLVAAGPENSAAALELAKDKGLLRLLLELYESHSEREDLRREALAAYAEELERKNMDEDAGLAYLAAGLPERATEAYMVAGQWRMALALAGKLGRGQEETRALAAELAEELAGSARLADAAAVTLEYLQDVAGAVSLLARGHEWREALRVAYSYQRGDMVDSMVAPQAAAAASETLRDIEETLERVGKYSSRLKDLRQRRHEMQAALAAADEEAGLPSRHRDADFDDAASEAVSLLSGLSVYTDRTHTGATTSAGSSLAPSTVGGRRTQRRNKKNKGTRIRQGSPEEEQQLAQHILSLAPSSTLCSQVGQLTETLVVLGHEGDARLLQQRLGVLCTAQQAAVQDVLQNPPPGLAMQLSWQAQQALAAQQAKQGASGNSLGTAVAAVLAAVPRAELQLKAAEAQASQKASRWKWDMLRTA